MAGLRAPSVIDTARTAGMLGLLGIALPVNLAVTAAALVRLAVLPSGPPAAAPSGETRRTVLVSGGKMTKALVLARAFHGAGHRVVLVETHKYRFTGHRFSRAVDAFHVVPEPTDPTYAEALLAVVRKEGVDVYVPVCSPVASQYDADAGRLLAAHCEVLHVDSEQVRLLDDKHAFSELARSLGLQVPESHRITAAQQVLDVDVTGRDTRFVLKSIPYDPVQRLDLTLLPMAEPADTAAHLDRLPLSREHPFVLQAFVAGQEYCTHSTVRDGHIQVYVCCRSSASQLNYETVDHPQVEAWVRTFVGALGLTGQVSFDVIVADDGVVQAIECNPRTHSAITLFADHPDLARAYLESGRPTITPLATARPTYWLYYELWRLLRRPATAPDRLRLLAAGRDAVFDWSDPLPFLLLHHLQLPFLLLECLRRGGTWTKIDVNIGKLVEPGGD